MHDGEYLIRQGETADRTYVITSGKVEVFRVQNGQEIKLGELGNEDFFAEMASVDGSAWSACVRSKGEAQVITIDQKFFLRKFHEDPSFANRILRKMSRRIRTLSDELCRLSPTSHRNEDLWEFMHGREKTT
jgi:CRP-like cAMP-binding protein